jgi:hypothetical protein
MILSWGGICIRLFMRAALESAIAAMYGSDCPAEAQLQIPESEQRECMSVSSCSRGRVREYTNPHIFPQKSQQGITSLFDDPKAKKNLPLFRGVRPPKIPADMANICSSDQTVSSAVLTCWNKKQRQIYKCALSLK